MITEQRLQFCTLRLLAPDLIEVTVDEGVELSVAQVREAHAAFDRLSDGRPSGALISKLHSYTYSFSAQKLIFDQPRVLALAYHAPDPTRRMALGSLLDVAKRDIRFPIKIFEQREEAIAWLREQLDAAAPRQPAR